MGLVVGDMRWVILVKSPSISKNDYGEEIETWTTLHTLRAKKQSGSSAIGSGKKIVDNDDIFTTENLVFTIHYRGDITEKMRIEYDGNDYLINNISEIGYRDGLNISVEKIND